MRDLHAAGVPLAMASSSRHEHVVQVLARGELTDVVSVIVGADDVPLHKPDPTPYVVAARGSASPPPTAPPSRTPGSGSRPGGPPGCSPWPSCVPASTAPVWPTPTVIVDEVSVAALVPTREELAS